MGYLDQLDRPRSYGAVTPNASADFWYQPIGMLAGAGVRVDEAAAMRVATFWRCTQVLADAVGMLPLHVYARTGGGKRRATDHWAYRLLHDRPNPLQTPIEFRAEQMSYLIVAGNAYARKEFALDGSVRALWPLPPSRVQVDTLADGTRRYRYRQDDQTEVTYSAEEIWHVRRWSRGGVGQSLLTHARESLGLAIALEQHAGSFFRQGAKPGGIVKYPGSLSKEAKQRFVANWNETHQGASNAYKVTVLDEGMDWVAAQMSNEDAQFLAMREFTREELLAWFGVPPHLAGFLTKVTCLPGDVLVYTEHGPRPVSEVWAGDRVWSLTGAKRFELARVFRAQQTGIDPILTIKTRGRTLRCNAQHRVLVRRKFPNPQPGIGGYRKVVWRNLWLEADQLQVGDYLVALNGLPEQESWSCPTRDQVTEAFMEVCGLLLGDGNIVYQQGKAVGVTFARHRAAPYMDHYRQAMRDSFTSLVRPRAGRTCNEPGCRRPHYGRGLCNLCWAKRYRGSAAGTLPPHATQPVHLREAERCTTFRSRSAAEELRQLGFIGTAHTKRVPPWVFTLAPDLQLAFLRGYLDSDGAADAHGWITYSSVNRALLEDIRHLCMGLGVPVGEVRYYRSECQPEIQGRIVQPCGVMYQLFLFDVRANRRIGSHHPRKAANLANARVPERVTRYASGFQGRGGSPESRPGTYFEIEGGALHAITSIEQSAIAQPVYDLGVEGNRNFIANGLIVHNSWGAGIEELSILFLVYTLTPWLVVWEQSANLEFLDGEPGLFSEFLVDALLRGAAISRAEAFSKQLQGGAITPNEWRAAENRNPEAGGDRLILPANMLPAEDLGKAAAAGFPPPAASPAGRRGPRSEEDGDEDAGGDDRARAAVAASLAATQEAIAAVQQVYAARLRAFVEDAVMRVIHKEQTVLEKAWKRAATDLESWQAEVNRFYGSHAVYVAEQLRVTEEAMGEYVEHQRQRLQAGPLTMDEWDAARQELVVLALAASSLERSN